MGVLQYIEIVLMLLFIGLPLILALGVLQFLLWVSVAELYRTYKGSR